MLTPPSQRTTDESQGVGDNFSGVLSVVEGSRRAVERLL